MVENRDTSAPSPAPARGKPSTLIVDHSLFVEVMRRAGAELSPLRKIESLLTYLESFPLGAHNREVAERIEVLLDGVGAGPTGRALLDRFRRARDRYMPPLLRS